MFATELNEVNMKTGRLLQALSIFVFTVILSSVNAVDWRQVASFAGSGTEQKNTDGFHVPGTEWRIVWSYTPDAEFPALTVFNVIVYPEGETQSYIEFIMQTGADQTTGTTYVHQGPGDYYFTINVASTQAYSITVDYDEDSVPKGGDTTGWATILGIIIAVVAIGTIFYATKFRQRKPKKLSSRKHRANRVSKYEQNRETLLFKRK